MKVDHQQIARAMEDPESCHAIAAAATPDALENMFDAIRRVLLDSPPDPERAMERWDQNIIALHTA